MECYTPATMVQHASRTAEAAEVSISIEAVLATLRAFDAEKCSISCTNIYFIPVIQVNLRVVIFWPRRSRPCRRRGPFYTLVPPHRGVQNRAGEGAHRRCGSHERNGRVIWRCKRLTETHGTPMPVIGREGT